MTDIFFRNLYNVRVGQIGSVIGRQRGRNDERYSFSLPDSIIMVYLLLLLSCSVFLIDKNRNVQCDPTDVAQDCMAFAMQYTCHILYSSTSKCKSV